MGLVTSFTSKSTQPTTTASPRQPAPAISALCVPTLILRARHLTAFRIKFIEANQVTEDVNAAEPSATMNEKVSMSTRTTHQGADPRNMSGAK